jgi:predicted transcriptional regulator of viral defense system
MSVKRRTPDGHALAELARRQHGVVSRRQLLELGHARATISDWEKDGKLHRLHRVVYAVGHEALSWEGRLLAAVLANEPAVASHKTAAWIWGLLRTRPGTFHLTAPTRRHRKELVVVHFARLDADDVTTVDGIPVTSTARTVLDLAPDETARDLGRLPRPRTARDGRPRRRPPGAPPTDVRAAPLGRIRSPDGRARRARADPRGSL